jgi:hypothetical protein
LIEFIRLKIIIILVFVYIIIYIKKFFRKQAIKYLIKTIKYINNYVNYNKFSYFFPREIIFINLPTLKFEKKLFKKIKNEKYIMLLHKQSISKKTKK